MRRVLLAAGAVLALAAAAPSHAATVTDATGDFLPSYAGAHDADLDVVSFNVAYDAVAEAFRLTAAMAGDIDPGRPGLYAIGVNTGTGVIAPFGGIGAPNVIFNQVIVVQKNGTAAVGGNALDADVFGNILTVVVPLARLPSTGFAPRDYGFNIWPRNGLGNNNQISDFAPDNATMTASIPEPAAWALMIGGFAVAGGTLRRRNRRAAVPV
jgi:hypothetical protein